MDPCISFMEPEEEEIINITSWSMSLIVPGIFLQLPMSANAAFITGF